MKSVWSDYAYPLVGWALVVYIVSFIWKRVHRNSYRDLMNRIPLSRFIGPYWRKYTLYKGSWNSTFVNNGVFVSAGWGGKQRLGPVLYKVRSNGYIDYVYGRYRLGMDIEDIQPVTGKLQTAFGAIECGVREHPTKTGLFVLELRRRDTLTKEVPPIIPPQKLNLDAVPVGRLESGKRFKLQLRGTHLLIAGAMGSGKSSSIWAILNGVAQGISDGTVEIWAVDPKGGMELSMGRPWFAYFEYRGFDSMSALLESAVDEMRDRSNRLADITRKHEPSEDEPHVLILVDEVAMLTAYLPDVGLRTSIQQSLAVLLTQGRAPGFTVIAALQDPRIDILKFRNLFPTRICFRVVESKQVNMVLGEGIRATGAKADKIPKGMPGIAYTFIEEEGTIRRVRFCHLNDSYIRKLISRYPRPQLAPQFPTIEGIVRIKNVHSTNTGGMEISTDSSSRRWQSPRWRRNRNAKGKDCKE